MFPSDRDHSNSVVDIRSPVCLLVQWTETPESDLYDYRSVQAETLNLKQAIASSDAKRVVFCLQKVMHRYAAAALRHLLVKRTSFVQRSLDFACFVTLLCWIFPHCCRHFANINSPLLFTQALDGTKELIHEFREATMQALQLVFEDSIQPDRPRYCLLRQCCMDAVT